MRPTGRLEQVHQSAYRRALTLRLVSDALPTRLDARGRRAMSWLIIEATTLWSEYSKAYYLSTAFRARDGSGNRIAHTEAIATPEDALTYAIRVARPDLMNKTPPWSMRDEPDWKQPKTIRKILIAMGASTVPQWDLGLGVQSRVTSDLPTMRNFFAHKGELAATRARDLRKHYGITRRLSPYDLLWTVPPADSQPIIWSWLDDLALTIKLTM